MSTHYAHPSHTPCPDCGCSGDREHVCDPEQVLDRRMHALREEIDGFECEFWAYLETAHGWLSQWLAQQKRPAL
jgi:hypothetical protein